MKKKDKPVKKPVKKSKLAPANVEENLENLTEFEEG